MNIFEAVIQGLIQGLTEFLPVSSSGHLSLFQYFTGSSGEEAFLFSIVLHLGTLLSVCVVFRKTIWELIVEFIHLISDLCTRSFHRRLMSPARRTLLFLMLSTVPLFVVMLVKDWVTGFSTDRDITVEGFCFLLTGCMLLLASQRRPGHKNGANIRRKDAVAIGVAQAIATMPGISRSGSTVSVGMIWGLEPSYAVSYSFILGVPAVVGAIILEAKDAVAQKLTLPMPVLITGFLSSVIFGLLAIKLVQWVIKGNKLRYFGYYTLGLGCLTILIGFIDHLAGYPIQQLFMH